MNLRHLQRRTWTQLILFCVITFLHFVRPQSDVGDSCTVRNTNERGVCSFINSCPEVIRRLQTSRVRPTTCGFQGAQTIVCCPSDDSNNNNPQQNRPTQTQGRPTQSQGRPPVNTGSQKRISERKCEEYSSHVYRVVEALPLIPDPEPLTFKVSNCEYSNTPLIVGGEVVNVGEFPHMAAIGWPLADGSGYAWNCGGSLISETYVLTAAHCSSDDRNTAISSATPTVVRLGEHNLKSDYDGAQPQDIRVRRIIRHPEFKPPSKYHDIALIELVSAARLNKFVRPACLWTNPTYTQNTAVATGWGRIQYAEDPSDELRRVSIKIIDQNVCVSLYTDRSRRLSRGIIEEQLCAGDLDGGKDTCSGDSGGPLQITSKENQCIFHVIGVTSFGRNCALPNKPGIYTKVSKYLPWIENQVWPNQ